MGADRVDRIVELITDGLVSAEGQTCGEGVTYEAQPLDEAPPEACEDPDCWCRDPSPAWHHGDELSTFRSDGFTIRRVMEDGTLGEPIEGIVSVSGPGALWPYLGTSATLTPTELADLADCAGWTADDA